MLCRALVADGHDVVVLSRRTRAAEPGVRHRVWDAKTLGDWVEEVNGASAVINLAGRSVSCRYTPENLQQMMDSRVESTRAVGEAIAAGHEPPSVWLQMSTATIYADSHERRNDEATGEIGGNEPGVPAYWEYSVRIARNWEQAQMDAPTPNTRRIALRTAMVMTPDQGGIFDVLSGLARVGLGGPIAGGDQRVSWIHGTDFTRAVAFLLERSNVEGAVNVCAPGPLRQADFMRDLRSVWGAKVGLPATKSMASLGAWALRSDPELLLKSRNVVPGRLLEEGFEFRFPTWTSACDDLVASVRDRPEGTSLRATLRDVIRLGRSG